MASKSAKKSVTKGASGSGKGSSKSAVNWSKPSPTFASKGAGGAGKAASKAVTKTSGGGGKSAKAPAKKGIVKSTKGVVSVAKGATGVKSRAKGGSVEVKKGAKMVGAAKPVGLAKPTKAEPVVEMAASEAEEKKKPVGITVVENKNKPRGKPAKKVAELPQLGAPLMLGGKKWTPLIASGPRAPKVTKEGIDPLTLRGKSPFGKRELDHYKQILLRKRGELIGDVRNMEDSALQDTSGSLSHLPQHAADQGSDAYDQSLAMDIAEVDRKLIREIDDALSRMAEGRYGLCEMTGKVISKERLEELPWTRFSIEAAREREKRTFFMPRGGSSGGSSGAGRDSGGSSD